MAKAKPKAKPKKSAAIREALKAAPDKPVAEIAKAVGAKPAEVSDVKAKLKKKKLGKSKAKASHKASKTVAPEAAHAALDTAFEFVTKVGGLLHAEQLLGKLKSIKERL